MLLAVNVLTFVLGYVAAILIAAHPQDIRKAIVRSIHNFRYIFDGVASRKAARHDSKERSVPANRIALSSSPQPSALLTRAQVEERFDEDSWQGLAYEDFKMKLLARGQCMKTYPCVYATMGYRAGDHRYVFLESDDPSEPRNLRKLAPALLEYLAISNTLGPNTSLVVVAAPSTKARSLLDYNNSFWDMLRGLRISDPEPWPKDIPQDTEDSKWTFCFNGEPVFPVMLTPAHQDRWSRQMPVPIIALQPKWVLDNLLGTPEKRELAQSRVRNLLTKYDTIDPSPDLTSYGEAGTSEIRQLCLADQNERVYCPYRNFDE